MARPTLTGRWAGGFAYIALLATLAVLMLLLGAAAADIAQAARREREAELLFAGRQYLHAIASYYENSPGGNHQYPTTLQQLLQDNRYAKPVRHLRRIYLDPMTGRPEWGLLRDPQGRIVGVHSLSQQAPLKISFDDELQQSFGDTPLLSYADWHFAYRPSDGSGDLAAEAGDGLPGMAGLGGADAAAEPPEADEEETEEQEADEPQAAEDAVTGDEAVADDAAVEEPDQP